MRIATIPKKQQNKIYSTSIVGHTYKPYNSHWDVGSMTVSGTLNAAIVQDLWYSMSGEEWALDENNTEQD